MKFTKALPFCEEYIIQWRLKSNNIICLQSLGIVEIGLLITSNAIRTISPLSSLNDIQPPSQQQQQNKESRTHSSLPVLVHLCTFVLAIQSHPSRSVFNWIQIEWIMDLLQTQTDFCGTVAGFHSVSGLHGQTLVLCRLLLIVCYIGDKLVG